MAKERLRSVARNVVLASSGLLLALFAAAASAIVTTPITENTTGDNRPAISGSNLVWRGHDGND